MRLILLGLTIALTTVACRPSSTATGINIVLEANPTVVQTGDTVTFTVIVLANNVSDVVIDYGDSSGRDQFDVGGSSTASVTFKHAYRTSGTYLARATVSDAVVGDREVSRFITVNPRTDSTQTARIATRHAVPSS